MHQLSFLGRTVYLRFLGRVGAADVAAAVREIAGDPAFDEQRFHVVDWADADIPELDDDLIAAMAPAIGATTTNRQITTIFVPDGEQTRGYVRHCRKCLSGLRAIHFQPDLRAALLWIDEQTMTLPGRVYELAD